MIVEDEVIVAEDLRRNLVASGYEVVAHAMDGREAIQMARNFHPDVILMDVCLGGVTNGIEAARTIQCSIDTAIIYVSGQCDETLFSDAVRSGASGYIFKPFQARQVTLSIEMALYKRDETRLLEPRPRVRAPAVPARQPHLTSMVQRLQTLLVDDDMWVEDGSGSTSSHGLRVTAREKEVIRGLVCYRRLGKVAHVLGISVHTARNHLKSIFRKLNLHSQDELLRFLLEGDNSGESDLHG